MGDVTKRYLIWYFAAEWADGTSELEEVVAKVRYTVSTSFIHPTPY